MFGVRSPWLFVAVSVLVSFITGYLCGDRGCISVPSTIPIADLSHQFISLKEEVANSLKECNELHASEVALQQSCIDHVNSASQMSSQTQVAYPVPNEVPMVPNGLRVLKGVRSVMIEVGLHSSIASPEPEQYVIGVEASLSSIATHLASVAKGEYDRTIILGVGMSDANGIVDWYERSQWTAANSLSAQPALETINSQLAVNMITAIPVIRLDTVLAAVPQNTDISMIKIDAQGHNINVIRGGGATLSRASAIFTECTTDVTAQGKHGVAGYDNPDDVCSGIRKHLETLGFVYLGSAYESPNDMSRDMGFAKPLYVESMKKARCFVPWQEDGFSKDAYKCMNHEVVVRMK